VHSIPKQMDGEKTEELALNISYTMNEQSSLINIVDCNKLLFSVFSLLHELGADDRPEVGFHVCDNGSHCTIIHFFIGDYSSKQGLKFPIDGIFFFFFE
jgi:hypothetical protein